MTNEERAAGNQEPGHVGQESEASREAMRPDEYRYTDATYASAPGRRDPEFHAKKALLAKNAI